MKFLTDKLKRGAIIITTLGVLSGTVSCATDSQTGAGIGALLETIGGASYWCWYWIYD